MYITMHAVVPPQLASMFTISNLLRFVLAAAVAAACGVMLLSPSSSCPCCATRRPDHDQLIASRNGTQADPSFAAAAAREDELAELLRGAAMDDKTIIMTFTNEAWTAPGSLLDLFLESFRVGDKTEPLLKHLVIVAVDGKAFEQCKRVHRLCYSLDDVGGVNFTAEQPYMSKDYLEMMWIRNKFQTRILELGYAFVFTDVDIVWFRNPLLRIPAGADITISSDRVYGEDPYDVWKDANGGFLYAKPNSKTIAFFKDWYEARKQHPGQHDQYVFDKVKYDLSVRHSAAVHLADTAYFGGFCQAKKDFRQLCTFHGNCLKGLRTKLDRLRGVLDEWKTFKSARDQGKKNSTTTQ